MKYSKQWLSQYSKEPLPEDSSIERELNKRAFEVEEVVKIEGDTIFDIKVLPNRAHDALGHVGMARELASALSLTFIPETRVTRDGLSMEGDAPSVIIDEEDLCTRFMSVRIDGVSVTESPEWLKKSLSVIGQKSINSIVDITNYVQFALNKPMHAYDAKQIEGALRARRARSGETLLTLDDKELTLTEDTLVIADDTRVLGLAGIKGGKSSGVSPDTSSIIIESANFEPTNIRKTSERYGIRTDASKRFENGIASSLVEDALYMTMHLVRELNPQAKCSLVTDVYPHKDTPYTVGVSLREVNEILGSTLSQEDVVRTLGRLGFSYEEVIPEEYIREEYPKVLGVPYKNPSSMRHDAPTAFSCSSLVSYLYKGVWMPSLSVDKYVFTSRVEKKDLRFGDMIFANTGEGIVRYESVEFLRGTSVPSGIDHVGIYVGDNQVVHSTKVRGCVVKETIEDFSQGRTIVGCGPVLDHMKEKRFVVTAPSERLDIRIKEDLVEEIGRIIGYDTLTPRLPAINKNGLLNKRAYYSEKVREILTRNNFSEVMTYTFGDVGDVRLKKGLAEDKEVLRNSLSKGVLEALALNLYNAPLLGQKTVRIFEIGNVFRDGKEVCELALAVDDGAKKSMFGEEVDLILMEIKRAFGVKEILCETLSGKPYLVSINFDELISSLEEPATYEEAHFDTIQSPRYISVSSYPFVTRDIAMWVPSSTTWESIYADALSVGNALVVRVDLFDTFTKNIDGIEKTSYAFRIVFQSYEKTLTDDEVNEMMNAYYELYKGRGYEIR